jgi:hypothetical protein
MIQLHPPLRLNRLGDRCLLKDARRLRQDAAGQGRPRNESNGSLAQNDALHVCARTHLDVIRNLPEDVLCKCAVLQNHIKVRGLYRGPSRLNG